MAVRHSVAPRLQPLCHVLEQHVPPERVWPLPCAHNMTVHGVVAHCSPSHPLVRAWIHAWPQASIVSSWRATAHRRDLRVTGRLAVPCSLYHTLRASLEDPERHNRRLVPTSAKCLTLSTRFWRTISPPPPPIPMHSTLPTGVPSHALCDPAVAPYPLLHALLPPAGRGKTEFKVCLATEPVPCLKKVGHRHQGPLHITGMVQLFNHTHCDLSLNSFFSLCVCVPREVPVFLFFNRPTPGRPVEESPTPTPTLDVDTHPAHPLCTFT